MKFKKVILTILCTFMLYSAVSLPAMAQSVDPVHGMEREQNKFKKKKPPCWVIDLANVIVTPLPIADKYTDKSSTLENVQQGWQTIESLLEVIQYYEKLAKLSIKDTTLAQKINQVKVTALELPKMGSETVVDAFKGAVADVKTPNVNFEKSEQTQKAVTATAVVANPVGAEEEQAVKERKAAFIQQAQIDLLSDVLVAKQKLADLKQSDTEAQNASSTKDSIGTVNINIQVKNFENQVQALEQSIAAMRNTREGILNLKAAKTQKEEVSVGGDKNG